MIDEMLKRFGQDAVIGYLSCSIYECIRKANNYHTIGLYEKRNLCCARLLNYIDEFERITGETAPKEDIFSELVWYASRENPSI